MKGAGYEVALRKKDHDESLTVFARYSTAWWYTYPSENMGMVNIRMIVVNKC